MSNSRRRNIDKPKKKCSSCGKEKAHTFFYKVDSPLFPDGMINICRDCVREQVDVDDLEAVIGFLRQIDKPFVEKIWNEAVQSGRHALGEYIRKINSLQQLKGKTFDDSDGIQGIGKSTDLQTAKLSDSIKTQQGRLIEYSDELVDKWGIGYKKHEYLQMEKFYTDMKETHEINTAIHIDQLKQLSYLSVERDRLRQAGDWPNYNKLSKTMEDMTKSAGFRPVDRQGLDDATGIRSFSQIFEEVEKRGFRKPPAIKFDEDIVDAMIVSLANYYNRLVGKQILSELPEDIKEELDEFYEVDETPVDLNEEDYDEMDFSLEDEEDE
ncbi:hypothetical protein FKN04_12440 [Bacillus glycinifermentans]|uniref:hypothetical protein n=1 Tax=Bacillus glycinifermentans TaxID=1664069 RepID=UPI001582B9BE|nr:hypothetical protein [Bacillus glycinifermentans]NUJ17389.1 hypothetical protein [Bacillus glycinifermentans]